ncbi:MULTISPECIES: transcription elongation factor GreA [Anaerococcus]|jgi:transcription elongation factor greA|uniref:Transcription elongation factor GreA n=1 Tax=Anaerococcus octavius TaxID=54007 RepID=A0A2I1M3P3_9FIRM|nr:MULTISPECIES: transcription elongation factor GreA [Anaerococcus]MDU5504960.1 transcription elongation factor GreA [Anaerococcus vaginalis]MBS6106382.1 transcription elongation factor GreA [Anaerococcus sp.]MDU2599487.1 transcription elongation factor GreA [Anaerococcus sp.]MDU3176618.1 transcription elongation factor GreA [Anaerococcus sp.]MDU4025673.1 transcription elongation factor GreA [Anaerococcus sp.]
MAENKEVILSKEYLEKLEDELEYLKTIRRPEIAEKIKIARSFGDLSENADYDEAKNEQGEIESRIAKVEDMIRNAKTIEVDENSDEVGVGNTVTVHDEEFDETMDYKIVGTAESDPLKGFISNESPVGAALLGKKVNDRVEVSTPNGKMYFTIKDIK